MAASSMPGDICVASAMVLAGMFIAGSGGSSFGFCGGCGAGGLVTGTVIFSLPGSSAFFGGSGIWLPPPPPPPPGPACGIQTISFGYSIGACGAPALGLGA